MAIETEQTNQETVPETLPFQKLSRRTKFIYGLGDWGTSASTAARNLFWPFFLVSVVGLRVELAGLVFLVGRIWDSVNDPLIGTLSDRLNTRWGRRRPLLLFGAIPFGIGFFLLFVVPPFESETGIVLYYIAVFLLFDTMYTLVNVPYSALTPELTEDYDERSSLTGWRIATAIFATLVAGATFKWLAEDIIANWLQLTIDSQAALRIGFAATAALWSVTLALPPIILFKNIVEPQHVPPDTDPIRPWQTFKEVFSNRPFRLSAIVYLLTFSTTDIVVTVLVWFLIFYVRVQEGFDNVILGTVLGLAFLTMPLTVRLMRYFGKRNIYIASMALFAVVLIIISQVPPGGQYYVLAAAAVAGLGYGAANVVPWAIVADVVEADELKTGKRREGLYAGYLVFFRKLATAFSVFAATRVLDLAGFQEGTTGSQFIQQPESALLALRLLVGFVPAVMLAGAIFFAWQYPLDRDAHLEIRRQLVKQRQARQI
ncbi:MAG: MFS transporter [Candidatus Promineifilaceae bacterium]